MRIGRGFEQERLPESGYDSSVEMQGKTTMGDLTTGLLSSAEI